MFASYVTEFKWKKTDFIAACQRYYADNDEELRTLKDFEEHYSPTDAIWWYTRPSFLYRLLNKALRIQNFYLLFLLRFFIRDVEQQLQDNKCTFEMHVYRGQRMSKDELDILKNNIGKYISINTFLSTSTNRNLSLFFINGSIYWKNVER